MIIHTTVGDLELTKEDAIRIGKAAGMALEGEKQGKECYGRNNAEYMELALEGLKDSDGSYPKSEAELLDYMDEHLPWNRTELARLHNVMKVVVAWHSKHIHHCN